MIRISRRILCSAALAGLALSSATPGTAAAQDVGSPIVGMWKYISNVQVETASGKVVKPYGDKVSGYLTYTKGGRMLWAHFGDNRPKPAVPFTDADRAKLFNTLSAGSGTYTTDEKTLTVTYDSSWNEIWTGTTGKRTFEIVGNKLTVTSNPVKQADGVETTFVIVLERVE